MLSCYEYRTFNIKSNCCKITCDFCSSDFDVLLPANRELELKPLTKTSDDFGIGFWIWFSEVGRVMLTIKLNGFMFEIGTTLTVSHSG